MLSATRLPRVPPVGAHHTHSPFAATPYIGQGDTEISPLQEFL